MLRFFLREKSDFQEFNLHRKKKKRRLLTFIMEIMLPGKIFPVFFIHPQEILSLHQPGN